MTLKEFNQFMGKGDSGNSFLKSVFISLVVSFSVFLILYFSKLKEIENFIPKYGFYLFLAVLSYSLIIPSLKHIRPYKEFPCMGGMMVGMTLGMISGFLAGFFIGATNGIFWGNVFGIMVGILFGVWGGKCCGIMGVMEGMMSGFMGGLMGAMTALMVFNDNLKAMSIIIFVISCVIIIGLNFMIYKETKSETRNHEDNLLNAILSFILTTLTIWIMIYGPRSALLQ